MQKEGLALQLMPRQRTGKTVKPENGKAASFYSNIFEIELKRDALVIYQYSFDISPELPQDSDGLIEKIAKVIVPDLKKNIGLIQFRGLMAWGRKQMKTVLTCKAQFTRNELKHCYEVLVKPTKSLSFEQFMVQNADNSNAVCQVLNINAKQRLRNNNMVELYPGSYYNKTTINDNKTDAKLSVWRGYDLTVSIYNNKMFLQIDPCSRVLREESFLSTMEASRKALSKEQMNMKYKGSPVLRKYGNPKIHKIQEIDYNKTPKSKFYFDKEGKDISYLDYYRQEYGVAIKSEGQPLLKVQGDRKKNRNKAEGDKEYIYLVPELVCLTGLTDEQRQNFRTMKELGKYTKLSAQERMLQTQDMVHMLKDDKQLIFNINEKPKALTGWKMHAPIIMLSKNKEAQVQKGTIFLKEKVLDPFRFEEMIFCYSVGKNAQDDRADADDALDLLRKAAKTFGINFEAPPVWVEVKEGGNVNNWYQSLLAQKKKMKRRADIIFFFVKPFQEKFYGDLKKFVALQFNCPCQFSRKKMLAPQSKGNMSVASKLAMQMNAKVGHPLWRIENEHKQWRNKTVAVGGIASSKGKNGTNIAFVGTTNKDLTAYFSDCKQVKHKTDLSSALFEGLFIQWIQNWFINNGKKTLPQVLVIYREGLNEVQAKLQFEQEVNGLLQTIEKVKKKAKQPQYKPIIVYLLVNKKPKSRIFQGESKGKNISYYNPDPGSIIFDDLSQGFKEFHLASAVVREGTCTPVSFKVGYENVPEFSFEAIAELTYNQTYCYYNWTGSVRVPATLQYANKLAKQYSEIGDELKTEDKNADIKSTLFYL